ncbi:MAG: hypothetical protein J6M53_06260, partial [Bacteroidaceae bacterium]|nr:hypothetical protein [Bacteroidaceae bacterium]
MKRIFTTLLLALVAAANIAQAQNGDPRNLVFHKTQPDGRTVDVRMHGGAHADFVFYTTTDGLALVYDRADGYCYARAEGGHLLSTG